MMKKPDTERILSLLEKSYPDAACSLEYGGDPWKLLVAVELSAQCTDARVNIVTKELFGKYPTAEAMSEADISAVEEIIRPCGLFRTKAKHICEASKAIAEKYGGKVPGDFEILLSLPGVGRKTANLVMGDVFGKGGIVADTHCMRICGRLGYYDEKKKDPLFTEREMSRHITEEKRSDFCHRLVLFGREYCRAQNPKCAECPLNKVCFHNTPDNI